MALPATDTFTGTNGTVLPTYSSNWVAVMNNIAIQSNGFRATTSQDSCVRWNADTFDDDQYSRITCKAIRLNTYIGVACRASASQNTWYGVLVDNTTLYLQKYVNNSYTEIDVVTVGLVVDDVLELRCVGTTISVLINDVEITSVTDTSISSGYAGVAGSGTSTSVGDDWEAGNIGGGGTDALTPNDLATGTPTLTAAAIGQIHAITASDLSAGTPALDTPTLGQVHALSGNDLATSAPTLTAPALGQIHALTGNDLTAGTPALDTPAIGQIHALTPTDLTTGVPILSTPTAGTDGTDALTVNNLATGAPTLSAPALGQIHALAASDLTAGTPVLGAPSIGQVHSFAGNDLVAGTPTISSPALGQIHALTGSDLVTGTPFFSAATLGQVHGLTALDLVAGTPTLSTPVLVGDAGSIVTAVYTAVLLANLTPTANEKANPTPTVSTQSNPTPAQEVYSG